MTVSQHAMPILKVVAPFDGRLLGEVPLASAEIAESALATAHALFKSRPAWLPAWKRMEVLRRAADLLESRLEAFAVAAASEGGKPLADSRVEITRAVDGLRNCAECLRSEPGHAVPMGLSPASARRLAFTTRVPIGVVLAVSAFNHPINLIVHQVGPALAAGCPVLVKPARDVPLSCIALVKLLVEAGLPAEWCQVVLTDSHETLERLVSDPRVAFLSFIGSPRVGWRMRSLIAPGTRCALEHGGIAPVIVTADAELEAAAAAVAKGGFYHAGQVCVSVQRVFVQREVHDRFVELVCGHAEKFSTGDPTLETTQVGPLIRAAEVARVDEWVQEAIAEGAQLRVGGTRLPGQCYAPTVLIQPSPQSRVSRLEIFGPVICVYGYDTIDEAIEQANDADFAFQAAIFTTRIEDAMKAFENFDCSAMMVNDHTAFRTDWMPFAGLHQSGLGVGGIPHTYREMAPEKMMVMRNTVL